MLDIKVLKSRDTNRSWTGEYGPCFVAADADDDVPVPSDKAKSGIPLVGQRNLLSQSATLRGLLCLRPPS